MNPPRTFEQVIAENEQLRIQLEEALDTIQAIRTGQVDAIVVEGQQGHELYTLKTADQTYRVFIETMHEGAVTLNEQGLILYSNSTFAAMVGRPLSSVIGSAFKPYITLDYQAAYELFIQESWQKASKRELTLYQGETTLTCLVSATPLQLDEGNCLSLILTDLTAQKQTQALLKSTNEALALANKALYRSNESLEQFAYVASHDLQEPLRKIQQFGDLLKSQYETQLQDGVNYLERMQSAASRMSTLIRALLTYSRISTLHKSTALISLNQVIDAVLTDLELVITEKKAIIEIDELPPILGDALQLGQLFQNLLSNSLKFGQAGQTPHITIRYQSVAASDLPAGLHPAQPAARYHQIAVNDNGVGFDEKYLDRIFQVFQRLHGRSEYAGTGIGLAICQKVVDNHGGAITAVSQPGQGATFLIYLPI
ncbi:PAS domain S-box-containing protein [Larkinella arboricola]|uniref:histidine kinase n=1 Tax=Larkinella arboricola TaxID=643671 RepID=A0A327WP43_LARAB|nr:ATP-binding protein [Larkinella arboricola]RAJ94128.1 PAS domain S-box-containing protein [Larkinella arboricola]